MAIRRRRFCSQCGSRFTTFERVQLCEITVIKNSGDRMAFDRDKLAKSIYTALRKRPMNTEQIECVVSGIVRKIETSGENEITTQSIGVMVLDSLKELDAVAYIRFASVYRDFSNTKDFTDIISTLENREDEREGKS